MTRCSYTTVRDSTYEFGSEKFQVRILDETKNIDNLFCTEKVYLV